jgi:hypothetical protein
LYDDLYKSTTKFLIYCILVWAFPKSKRISTTKKDEKLPEPDHTYVYSLHIPNRINLTNIISWLLKMCGQLQNTYTNFQKISITLLQLMLIFAKEEKALAYTKGCLNKN